MSLLMERGCGPTLYNKKSRFTAVKPHPILLRLPCDSIEIAANLFQGG
jgi:hypothetical protein